MKYKYLYEINLTEEVRKNIFCFTELFEDIKSNNDLPLTFTSINNNLYLVVHGNKKGEIIINDCVYSLEEINTMYRSLAFANKFKINIICCYGLYVPKLKEKLGITIRPVIKSRYKIKTRISENNTYQILTREKVKIPKSLRDDIIYKGVINKDERTN